MIIELLLEVVYNLLSLLLIFKIPQLPQTALDYIDTAFDYLTAGAGLLANYTPLEYLLSLFGILLLVDVGINVYHFVMWIVKKIPMLGIK